MKKEKKNETKQIEEIVEEPFEEFGVDNLEQSDKNLNDENHINENSTNLNDQDSVSNHINENTINLNDHDNVPNASNIEDVSTDEHLIPPLDIYDPRNWGNLDNEQL